MNHRTAQKSADCFHNRRFPAVKPLPHPTAPIPLGRNRIYIALVLLAVVYQSGGKIRALTQLGQNQSLKTLGGCWLGMPCLSIAPTRQSSCKRRTTYQYYFVPLSSCLHCHKSRCDDDTKTYIQLGIFQEEIIQGSLYDKIFSSIWCKWLIPQCSKNHKKVLFSGQCSTVFLKGQKC